jgi:glucokinase
MAFAEPSQLLASRSYFDVVNAISEDYDAMFNYMGMKEDKHIRRHALYEVTSDATPLKLIEAGAQKIAEEELSGVQLTQEHLDMAQTHLAAYIGLMAKLLVERFASQAHSVSELYKKLAEEIDGDEQRREFLDAAGK